MFVIEYQIRITTSEELGTYLLNYLTKLTE